MSTERDGLEWEAYETPEPPAGMTDEIMTAVRAGAAPEQAGEGAGGRKWPVLVAASALAVAAAAVLLVVLTGGDEAGDGTRVAGGEVSEESESVRESESERGLVSESADESERGRESAQESERTLVRVLPDRAAREKLMAAIRHAREARESKSAETPVARAEAGGPANARGTVDRRAIQEAMGEVRPLLVECYEMALDRAPDLAGTLKAKFEIVGEPDVGGLVAHVELEAGEGLADDGFLECMRETIYSLQLPPPEGGGEVSVVYPFIFRSDDGAGPTHRMPPHGGWASNADRLAAARSAAKAGLWKQAYHNCYGVTEEEPDNQEARMVCVIAACHLGDASAAALHYGALGSRSRRAMVRQICLKNDVELAR